MKKYYSIFVVSALFVLVSACSVSRDQLASRYQSNHYETSNPNIVTTGITENNPQSWENLFKRVPGVYVTGSYPNLSLRIRGISSFNLTNEPLYVLHGVPLGHDFSVLASTITAIDVKYIRVLKGHDATIYGSRGANGVIEVFTKGD